MVATCIDTDGCLFCRSAIIERDSGRYRQSATDYEHTQPASASLRFATFTICQLRWRRALIGVDRGCSGLQSCVGWQLGGSNGSTRAGSVAGVGLNLNPLQPFTTFASFRFAFFALFARDTFCARKTSHRFHISFLGRDFKLFDQEEHIFRVLISFVCKNQK